MTSKITEIPWEINELYEFYMDKILKTTNVIGLHRNICFAHFRNNFCLILFYLIDTTQKFI